MATPQEQRNARLKHDYGEMQNIAGGIVQWTPIQGDPPYVEHYRLSVNVRTVIGSGPRYRSSHVIDVELPASYPIAPPRITMQSDPQPYHPNWYLDRHWCFGTWNISEGLGHHVIRMIRTLQFDLEITNPNSPANPEANRWFLANKNRGLFPCDHQVLPDPTKRRFSIKPQARPRFNVRG